MSCECFNITIVNNNDNTWIQKELSINTPTGTFGNGQPYWIWFDAATNTYYELSQVNGVGSWSVRYSLSPILAPNVADTLSTASFSGNCPSNIGFIGEIGTGDEPPLSWFLSLDGFLDSNPTISSSASTWPCWDCENSGFYLWFAIGELPEDIGVKEINSPTGTFGNGSPYYQFELILIDLTPSGYFFQLSRGTNGAGNWQLFRINTLGVDPTTPTDLLGTYTGTLTDENCPIGFNGYAWIDENGSLEFITDNNNANFSKPVPAAIEPTCCLNVTIQFNEEGTSPLIEFELNAETGTCINGAPYWNFEINSEFFQLRRDDIDQGCQWQLVKIETLGEPCNAGGTIYAVFEDNYSPSNCVLCPFGNFTIEDKNLLLFNIAECGRCNALQERDFRKYDSIKLPVVFQEQDRGFFRCCEPELVLASDTSDSWKNDKTAAWIKLSNPLDSVTFGLNKDGQPANYVPTVNSMPNEQNGFYTVVDWKEVLSTDGPGCYEITIDYDISGILGSFTWGVYKLLPYTIENALKTARVRTIFNSYHEVEGIDFTGALVENTFRFYGLIGLRQPNTEIDNIIYQDRTMKKVIRENLNTYEINTDPLKEEYITKLTDVLLLGENQLFISDYNAHNHSYKINDLPVILQESPEIEYFDLARDAVLTAIVSDKVKNKRSYYK